MIGMLLEEVVDQINQLESRITMADIIVQDAQQLSRLLSLLKSKIIHAVRRPDCNQAESVDTHIELLVKTKQSLTLFGLYLDNHQHQTDQNDFQFRVKQASYSAVYQCLLECLSRLKVGTSEFITPHSQVLHEEQITMTNLHSELSEIKTPAANANDFVIYGQEVIALAKTGTNDLQDEEEWSPSSSSSSADENNRESQVEESNESRVTFARTAYDSPQQSHSLQQQTQKSSNNINNMNVFASISNTLLS